MIRKNRLELFLALLSGLFLGAIFSSCSPSSKAGAKYLYFEKGSDSVAVQQKETIIQLNDVLIIQVYSKTLNQEQAAIFNIPASAGSQGYQVNIAGNLDIPVIGAVKAQGLTKDQLQASLVQKLTDYVKNPSVLIRFLQFNVNVIGEVKSPGIQRFTVDHVTIIDAISAAGDLTDFGKREDITVIREEDGRKIYHKIDLSQKNLFNSPVFTMRPNDIVYVGPTKNKVKSLNLDPAVQRRTSLLLTVLSVGVSITTLIITVLR